MNRSLRVLIVAAEPPYPPTHGGGRLTLYQVLKHLSARHELTLLTLLEHAEDREFVPILKPMCREVVAFDRLPTDAPPRWRERLQAPHYRLAYSSAMAAAIQQHAQTNAYDLVHTHMTHSAVYAPLLGSGPKILSALDSQTLAYTSRLAVARGPREQLRARWLLSRVRAYERRQYRLYDRCLVVADEDRAAIQQLCPRLTVVTVPNGVDLEHFRPVPFEAEQGDRLLFTGTMNFGPNVDACVWFVSAMLPRIRAARPAVRFEIAGRAPTDSVQALAQPPTVTVSGFAPDFRPAMTTTAVYVCPLRMGSGMKNKILEAMAMGKAIVTTPQGVTGIGGRAGEHYLVADQPELFAAAVVDLLGNPSRRRQLGQAARQFVEANYSWERTAELYHRQYLEVARQTSLR